MVWALSAALAAGILQRTDVLAGAFAVLLVLVWRVTVPRVAAATVVLLCFFLFAYGSRESTSYQVQCVRVDSCSVRAGERALVLDGVVASYPLWAPGGVRFEFIAVVDSYPQRLRLKANTFAVAYGDSLSLNVRLDAPQRMRRSDYLRGYALTGSGRVPRGGITRLSGHGGNTVVRSVLWPLHDGVRRVVSRGGGATCGAPMALLLGERGYLPRWVRDAFSTLGISHLIALSGFHLGLVSLAVLALMRWARLRNRFALVFALVLYVGIVGFIPSLYRALLMAVIFVFASRLHRPMRPVTGLANAFLLMLLFYPQSMFSLGFQLSFMATYSVLLCVERMGPAKRISRMRRFVQSVWATLWVSAVVQAWVGPVLLHNFGVASLVAPVATAVFVFPIIVILSCGALAAVLGAIHWQAGMFAFSALDWMTRAFLDLLSWAVALAPPSAEMPMPFLAPYFIGMWLAMAGRGKLWITVSGAFVAGASCVIPWFLR